jgi:hypothetical protein
MTRHGLSAFFTLCAKVPEIMLKGPGNGSTRRSCADSAAHNHCHRLPWPALALYPSHTPNTVTNWKGY